MSIPVEDDNSARGRKLCGAVPLHGVRIKNAYKVLDKMSAMTCAHKHINYRTHILTYIVQGLNLLLITNNLHM